PRRRSGASRICVRKRSLGTSWASWLGTSKSVQVVAAAAAQNLGKAAIDLGGMVNRQAADQTIGAAFEVLLPAFAIEFGIVQRPHVNDVAVGEQHSQFEDVIDRLPVGQ